jgi:hypothetical protein
VVTWVSEIGDLDSHDHIYAQRYSVNGVTLGAAVQVSTNTGIFRAQTVAPLADGGFVVAWQNNVITGGGSEILFQVFAASGGKLGGETVANTTTVSFQQSPAAVPLADGGFVISWESQFQDGSGYGVYAQRYDYKADAVGSEFRINSYTNSDQAAPSMATLTDGSLVVTWASYYLKLTFVAERPPPLPIAYQERLMAAETSAEYFS